VDGWEEVKAVLWTTYSNQQISQVIILRKGFILLFKAFFYINFSSKEFSNLSKNMKKVYILLPGVNFIKLVVELARNIAHMELFKNGT
jgi:hypothetical protein